MQVTVAALGAVFTALSLKFQSAFKAYQSKAGVLYTRLPSNTRTNTYGWMTQLPFMKEWIGERQLESIGSQAMSVTNKDYELTVVVKKNDLADDQMGIYGPMTEMVGQQAAAHPDRMVVAALKAGETTTGYDGQYIFDTDHPVDMNDAGKGTQANLFTGMPLTAANYDTVRTAMRILKASNGEPLGVNPTHLIVPPQLEGKAKTIVAAEKDAAGATNTNFGTTTILVLDELADDATSWYLADLSKPLKPFIWQDREAAKFDQITEATSENVFMRKEFIFGTDLRGAAAAALFWLIGKAKA
jgi:phage major head subunit gpT-like protein